MMGKYNTKRKNTIFHSLCLILILTVIVGFSESGYVIQGNIIAPEGTQIKMVYEYRNKAVINSGFVKNNQIVLKGVFPESVVCTLSNSINQQIKIFVSQNTQLKIQGTVSQFYKLSVEGSAEDDLYRSFKEKSQDITGDYRGQLHQINGQTHDKQSVPYLRFRKRIDSLTLTFVEQNPSATAAALAVINSHMNSTDADKASVCYQQLSEAGRATFYAKRLKQFIDSRDNIQSGKPAPDFTLKDLKGSPVALSDYKGKFVLLDFWASWCGPCREEHPLLRSLQARFGQKIQFISVSMDRSEDSWRQAVTKDQLTWPQLNDPQAVNGKVGDSYGIRALPFNCIVDREGNILATKLRGKNLEDFLVKLFES